jgi:hypothetical protein
MIMVGMIAAGGRQLVPGNRRRVGAGGCGKAERVLAERSERTGFDKRERRRDRQDEPQRKRQHGENDGELAHRPTMPVQCGPRDSSARHIRPQRLAGFACRENKRLRQSPPSHNLITRPSIGRRRRNPIGYGGAPTPPQPAAFEGLPYTERRQADRDVAGALQQGQS